MKTFVRRLAAVLTAVLLCFNLYYELAPGYIVGPEWKIAFAAGFVVLLGVSLFYGVPKSARGARRAHKRGRFAPSCESPPPGDVYGCPRPQTNLSTYCGKI